MAWRAAPGGLVDALAAYGAVDVVVGRTVWAGIGIFAGLVVLVSAALAVRDVGGWPEMGTRYDAPGAATGSAARPVEPDESTNLDLWRAMDEGEDPTR